MSGELHATVALPPEKNPVPLSMRRDGPQSRSGRFGKNGLVSAGI